MSAEDGPEHGFGDNYYDSKSPSSQQSLSQKDLFTDEVKEEMNEKKNRQTKYNAQIIPPVAVSEKIIVCIDTSQDSAMGYPNTFSNKNITEAPTIMFEALRVFFANKLAIAKDTMFALVSCKPGRPTVELISNFTSDVQQLVKALSEMKSGTNEEEMLDYDFTAVFSNLFSSIDLPEIQSLKIPPEFVVRVIFIYNNSFIVPRLNDLEKFHAKFLKSPFLIFDIVHLHEAESDFNSVGKIYDQFSKIISPHSYLLECPRNVTLVFNTFSKLLAHPYQRVNQSVWKF